MRAGRPDPGRGEGPRCARWSSPGMSTLEIDEDVEAFIRRQGAAPAFKGYRGFPATVCISINEEVVHGIPSAQAASSGRATSSGWTSGASWRGTTPTARSRSPVGTVPPRVQELLDVTRESLDGHRAVPAPGNRLGDVSHAVQAHVESARLRRSCARSWATASAGRSTRSRRCRTSGIPGAGPLLKPGMVLAIEPMVTMGALGGADAGGRLDGGDRRTGAWPRTSSTRSRSRSEGPRC